MNFSNRVQQFFERYLPFARSDLVLWCSFGNLLDELLIAQKSLVHGLVITLLVPLVLPLFDKVSVGL